MEKLKQLDYVRVIFLLTGIVALFNASFALATTSLVFAAYMSFASWLKIQQTPDIGAEVKKDLEQVKSYVSAMTLTRSKSRAPDDNVRLF